jgi:hypothetical protein
MTASEVSWTLRDWANAGLENARREKRKHLNIEAPFLVKKIRSTGREDVKLYFRPTERK